MTSKAATVEDYLAALPEDRREAIAKVREVILANLDEGFEEGMQYGMIGYFVPHSIFPAGYHCDPKQPLGFVGIGSQKNYMSLYLGCVYQDPELDKWFRDSYLATGKRLDMGKGCVRFKKLSDLPLELVAEVIKRSPLKEYVETYERVLAESRAARKK